jgi:hypothetical protein
LLLVGCATADNPCGCRGSYPGVEDECSKRSKSTVECEGNACADASVTQSGNTWTLKNKSTSRKVTIAVKWFIVGGGGCGDYSDVTLGPGQVSEWGNWTHCFPYKANYADASATTNPGQRTPRITSFTITPNNTTVGNSLVFKIILDSPAPSGGTEVVISSNTITGLTSTLKDMPYGTMTLKFNEGSKEWSQTIRTERPEHFSETYIKFTAINRVSEQNTDVRIR